MGWSVGGVCLSVFLVGWVGVFGGALFVSWWAGHREVCYF